MVPEWFSKKEFWQQLLGVVVVLSVVVVLAGKAQAVPLVSDGDMSIGNWFSQIFSDTTPGGDASSLTMSEFGGGNPGSYLEIQHTYTGPGGLLVGHANFLTIHFPAFDGVLDALTYSFDVNFFNTPGQGGSPPGGVAFRAMLFQDNNVYQAGFQVATAAVWTTLTFTNLLPSDFVLIDGIGAPTPDFSLSGAPMLFGFFSANSSCCGGANVTTFGVDNFTVSNVAAALPLPASAALLMLGAAVLAARRRV